LEVTPNQAEIVALAASMGQLSLSLRSVPAGEDAADNDIQQISTASDLGISPAMSDFLLLGTLRDPNLLRRRIQLSRFLNVGKKTAPAAKVIESENTNSVTIYRATTPSTVIVKR
jgi:hypothetical protein